MPSSLPVGNTDPSLGSEVQLEKNSSIVAISRVLLIIHTDLKRSLILLPKNMLIIKTGITERVTPSRQLARLPYSKVIPLLVFPLNCYLSNFAKKFPNNFYTLPSNIMTASRIAVVRITAAKRRLLLARILSSLPFTLRRLSSSIGRNLASFRTRLSRIVLNYLTITFFRFQDYFQIYLLL